jgi:hypothetical protein
MMFSGGGTGSSNNAGNEAINNTVTLQGNTGIGGSLYGGYVSGGNAFTGNTLNVKNPFLQRYLKTATALSNWPLK